MLRIQAIRWRVLRFQNHEFFKINWFMEYYFNLPFITVVRLTYVFCVSIIVKNEC